MSETSRDVFINNLRTIKREGSRVEELIQFLDENKFFYAPASSKYQYSYQGGLVDHCNNVLEIARDMVKFHDNCGEEINQISDESIVIVSLLHDLYKCWAYSLYCSNEKVYSEDGSKSDQLGRFDWVSNIGYKWNPINYVKMFQNPLCLSDIFIRSYIPLTIEESSAIQSIENREMTVNGVTMSTENVYSVNPLATLMSGAEFISMRINKK